MIDKIILSCNEDTTYSSFWPEVATAYKKMFPECEIHLAFVTHRDTLDPLVEYFGKFGTVTTLKPFSRFPEFGQAKMARFFLAAQMEDAVCYIDDIDLFPLSKAFITDKTDKRPKDHLLCVGGEVYNNNGCYPISQITAEGYIFKKFINPNSLDWHNAIEFWWQEGMTHFEDKENIGLVYDFAKDVYFSDERLIRALRKYNPVDIHEEPRGYGGNVSEILDITLDRMDWNMTEERLQKLKDHKYVNAHGSRPFDFNEYKPLIDYVHENY